MRLLVVIVNYRTADLTIDCLRSLRDEIAAAGDARVVVVDNASQDDSVPRLNDAIALNGWGTWASVLSLEHNGGFAVGNNAAIAPALASADPPRYVHLLNPDTLVRPGAIRALLEFMDANPNVGLSGSRLEDPDGSVHASAFRFPTVLSELESAVRMRLVSRLLSHRVIAPPISNAPCRSDWVAGASMLIRRDVFDAVGLLDEGYFMYFEEVDFCRRAARAGWPCWYVPASRVVHLVGQSSGVTGAGRKQSRRPSYWFASRRRFFITHYGRARALLADVLWTAGYAIWVARRALLGARDDDPPRLLTDFLRYNLLKRQPASRLPT